MSCLFLPLEALDKAGKTLALSIAIGGVDLVGIHGEHALGSIAHPGDDRPDFLWVRFWDSSTIKHGRVMEQLPMSLIPCTHAGPFPCDLRGLSGTAGSSKRTRLDADPSPKTRPLRGLRRSFRWGCTHSSRPLWHGSAANHLVTRVALIRLTHPSCASVLLIHSEAGGLKSGSVRPLRSA